MEKALTERFMQLIDKKSSSVLDFSKKIGIAQTTLSSQLSSARGISVNVVTLTLNAFPDISAEWLLRGEGSMLKSENEAINKGPHSHHISPQRYETMLNLLAEVTEDLKETVIENQKLYEEIEELKTKLKMPQSA